MISVIMPIYNGERYVEESIGSVLKQSYGDFELILVNDGSTDKSLEICEKFQKIDKRIKIITQNNQGLSAARNTGIDYAKGEYLLFFDADDILHSEALEIMYAQTEGNRKSIVVSHYSKFVGHITESKEEEKCKVIEYTKETYMEEIYLLKKNTYACFTLIPKGLMDDIRFPRGKYFEDMATMYKVVFKTEKIIYIDRILAWYRQHEGSIVSFMNEKKAKDYIEAVDTMCEYINERIPYLTEQSKVIRCYCKIAVIERGKAFVDKEFINSQYRFVEQNIKIAQNEVESSIQKIKFQLFRISPKLYFQINKLKKLGLKG